jgi:pimeloyl-ACP methyl ester carboxylesterase
MPAINLDGEQLYFQTFGAGSPLLLIHGLGSSGDDWAFQIEPLARRHLLVVPDLPGSGRSPAPHGPYCIRQFASTLWRLLDALGIAESSLLGFSLGGAVALEMALQRPGAAVRVMTINSLPSYRQDSWRKRYAVYGQMTMMRLLGPARLSHKVARRLFPQPHQAPLRARVVEVLARAPRRPYLASAFALARWCALDRLHRLQAPLLMLAGEHDYTPLGEKQAYASRLGAQFAVVQGSRHGTPFDSIAACNACAVAFFAGEPLPDPRTLRIDPPERVPETAPDLAQVAGSPDQRAAG